MQKKKFDNCQSRNPCQEEEVENKKCKDSDKDDDGKQASKHITSPPYPDANDGTGNHQSSISLYCF